ncbi:uncharacterized protein PHALS_14358 [Plasmopara halstedii]|uniref:Uncharacterized protein n=1 Tax=Plasmopara halstedii TaxID=4781 RepID=A0A0N7L6F0_PLAHL|nr:uncharacterized protein PHALS_14358 [Plasmopara halstedii]CEG44091.1 hypothetical protein PHALS_14358 [Plasmopara halstedii]|eukprot:XP_024580460.1 hypothetical protein PHALS_14358 [Plasmopara halstedii]
MAISVRIFKTLRLGVSSSSSKCNLPDTYGTAVCVPQAALVCRVNVAQANHLSQYDTRCDKQTLRVTAVSQSAKLLLSL